jgi:putative membrane protein
MMTISERSTLLAFVSLQASLSLLWTPSSAAGQARSQLSDAEIADVVFTADSIDVATSELAEGRARNGQVQAFAQAMIDDHTAALERIEALGVDREDNRLSRTLRTDATKEAAKFDDLAGTSFGRSFIARQVAFHREMLDLLDRELIPNARDEALKALLNEMRPTIARHLEEAEELDDMLHADR